MRTLIGYRQIVLTLAAVLANGLASSAHAQSACGCNDVAHMQARSCAARACVSETDRLINWTGRAEERSGQPEKLSGNEAELRTCVDEMSALSAGPKKEWQQESCASKKSAASADTSALTSFLNEVQAYLSSIGPNSKSSISHLVEQRQKCSQEATDVENELQALTNRCPRSMFEIKDPRGRMIFSLTPCPTPTLPPRQCKRI